MTDANAASFVTDGRERPLDVAALYRLHRVEVGSLLAAMLGSGPDVEDAVQAVFAGAVRTAATFRGECSPRTWLRRIAVRVALHELRRRRRKRWLRLLLPEESVESYADPRAALGQLESRQALVALQDRMAQLSPPKRAAFVLVDVQGMSLEEAAETMQVPINTARSRLGAARRELLTRGEGAS